MITVMAAYALGITPMTHHLLEIKLSNKLYSKEIAYADDFTVAGSVKVEFTCYIFWLLSKSIEIPPHCKNSILGNSKCCLWKHQNWLNIRRHMTSRTCNWKSSLKGKIYKWTCYQFKQSPTTLVKNSRDWATISICSIR